MSSRAKKQKQRLVVLISLSCKCTVEQQQAPADIASAVTQSWREIPLTSTKQPVCFCPSHCHNSLHCSCEKMNGTWRHYRSAHNNVWSQHHALFWCFVWSQTWIEHRWCPLSPLLWEEFPVFFLVMEKQRCNNVNLHHVCHIKAPL